MGRKRKITSLDTVGERITHIRDLLHLNRTEFEKRMGHKPDGDTLYLLETGRQSLSMKNANDICAVYHVNLDWLLIGTGEIFEEGCDPDSIAKRIREYRDFIMYTQADMAERLGLSGMTIENIEKGKTEFRLDIIGKVLGANEEWLKTGKGSMVAPGATFPDASRQIKELMDYLGLTYRQIERDTGIPDEVLSLIVRRKRAAGARIINRLCDYYGVRKEWLRDGISPMFQEGREQRRKIPIKGDRLRKVREALHMSKSAFAKKIGKLPNEMLYYENGKHNISDEMAQAVCDTFSVSKVWLYYGEGGMFTRPLDIEKPRLNGKKLYEYRLSLGLSAEKFAKLAHLASSSISCIENEKVEVSDSTEKKLIEAYGEDINNLRDVPWTIPGRLYLLRANEKLSLRELGKKLSVTGQSILDIEEGKKIQLDDYIAKYCEAFDVEEKWIRTGEGPTYKPGREGITYNEELRNEKVDDAKQARKERLDRYPEMAARLRKLRSELGISQKEFAARIGASGPTIANMELLKNRSGITEKYVGRISKEFGVNPEWIEYGTGEMLLPGRTIEKKNAGRRGTGRKRKIPTNESIEALKKEIRNLENELEAKRYQLKLMEESLKIEDRKNY